MPAPPDHTILNQVQTILLRRWIDAGRLDVGSVNGVVYVRGDLQHSPHYPVSRAVAIDASGLRHALERDLRAIPGVKDVAMALATSEDEGNHWERNPVRTA